MTRRLLFAVVLLGAAWGGSAPAEAQVTEQLQAYLADKLYLTGLANTPFFHGVRDSVKGYTFVDKLHLHFEAAWLER